VLRKQNSDDVGCAATMRIVARIVDPDILVEIECDAMVDG
jgi:hypothetical protein